MMNPLYHNKVTLQDSSIALLILNFNTELSTKDDTIKDKNDTRRTQICGLKILKN